MKMLPFDNKSEFQVIIDMPDGTPLEQTTRVAQALGKYLGQQPEVVNYQIYAGTSGPYNFNGLVRHYFLRQSAQSGRYPGESALATRSQGTESRDRTTVAAGIGQDRRALRCAHQSRGSPARSARASNASGGSVWA